MRWSARAFLLNAKRPLSSELGPQLSVTTQAGYGQGQRQVSGLRAARRVQNPWFTVADTGGDQTYSPSMCSSMSPETLGPSGRCIQTCVGFN